MTISDNTLGISDALKGMLYKNPKTGEAVDYSELFKSGATSETSQAFDIKAIARQVLEIQALIDTSNRGVTDVNKTLTSGIKVTVDGGEVGVNLNK